MKFLRSLALVLSVTALPFGAEIQAITPLGPDKLVADGKAVLVDVREPAEWAQTGVAKPAVLLSKSAFESGQKQWTDFLASVGDKQVILYCRSGHRAGLVGAELAKKGINVANAGGF